MAAPTPESSNSGQYAFEGLDRVLHEKARLGILSSLIANPQGLVFNELKTLCDLTDGNLSRHMQVLEDAGLVEVWKGSHGKRPQTLVRLTGEGRAERHQQHLLRSLRPAPGALARAVSEAGSHEGEPSQVDAVGVRLERARNEDQAARRPSDEEHGVGLRDALLGEPCGVAPVVRRATGIREQALHHGCHVLRVALPGHEGG